MKRFHVHVSVADLNANIQFYSNLFGVKPTVEKHDYAKWMLDDPRINFAISQRGLAIGVNHLGVQVESDEELQALRCDVTAAGLTAIDQAATACCYAESNKHWIQDPQGIAWETFHTLGEVPVFGDDDVPVDRLKNSCCVPLATHSNDASNSACCVPAPKNPEQQNSCCN